MLFVCEDGQHFLNGQSITSQNITIMTNFMQEMGYNCPDMGWKAQVKMLAQLVVIGAVMAVPMVAIMALAGWLESICE